MALLSSEDETKDIRLLFQKIDKHKNGIISLKDL